MKRFLPVLLISCSIGLVHEAQANCRFPAGTAETARGTVYLDANGNDRQEASETGIAGVSVSNGCEVVVTDADGRYQIPLHATQILFISKPAAYGIKVDANNIPRFYYLHYPDGTPDIIAGTSVAWAWPVVEPTGPLPARLDFGLLPLPAASNDFLAHGFADPQARYESSQDMLREDLINPLVGNPYGADFGLTVGDVGYDNLALYDRHKVMMGLMGIPQWYLPGNHDINFNSPDAVFANETYKRHFGPTYYSFNHGNVHFVALNNVEYAGLDQRFGNERYRGYITDHQLTWLEQDLARVPTNKLIVIATHIPLVAEADDGRTEPATGPGTENFTRLLEILAPFSSIYGLAGHDTSNSWKVEVNHQHGWQGNPWIAHTLAEVRGNGWTNGPSDTRGVRDAMMEDGNPNGFYLLRFNDTSLTPEFIPFPYGADAAQRMRITLDPLLLAPEADSVNRGTLQPGSKIVVNLFDGGVRDKVWLRLNGGERQAMTYTVRTDPFVERLHAQYAETDSAYGTAVRSSHLWELALPAQLAPGLQLVEVESEDEFGQRQRGVMTFEILAFPAVASAHAQDFDLQAHRGGMGLLTENSLEAFANALQLGVSTLELDTQVTEDGKVIVTHDRQVLAHRCRDTGPVSPDDSEFPYVGKYIKTLTLAQVRTLDCGSQRAEGYPGQKTVPGARLVLLSEIFDLVKQLQAEHVMLNIETKVEAGAPDETVAREPFVQAVLHEIRQADMLQQVTIQSFDWGALMLVRELEPTLPIIALSNAQSFLQCGLPGASPWTGGIDMDDYDCNLPAAAASFGANAISPVHGLPQEGRIADADYTLFTTQEMVTQAHALGLKIIPWTIDDADSLDFFVKLGVDGIITNYPDRLQRVLQESKQ